MVRSALSGNTHFAAQPADNVDPIAAAVPDAVPARGGGSGGSGPMPLPWGSDAPAKQEDPAGADDSFPAQSEATDDFFLSEQDLALSGDDTGGCGGGGADMEPILPYNLDKAPKEAPHPPPECPSGLLGLVCMAGAPLFGRVDDLFSYSMLRGQTPMFEEHCDMASHGFNVASPVPLPSLGKVRASLAAMSQPMLLRTSSFERARPDGDGAVQVRYVAPSARVRRDIMVMDTCDKFLAAEYDVLVPRLSLGGADVDAGDVIDIVLSAPHPMRRVRVENILILLTRGQC